jgi:oligopeptide transport system permease protein
MLRYFLSRLAAAIPTLFLIVTATFFLMRAAPAGDIREPAARLRAR